MHLKKAVVAGFVTTVLFSTGFMVYLNSTTITLRKYSLEGLILDDGRNSLHITASLPSETAAPILVNTMHQIEIVSKSSPHPHKQQHLTNYPVEMTREGVNRNMGVVIQDTTTASERLKHGEVVEPITSSAYHRNSSSTPHLDKMEQLNMPIEKNVHPLLNKMSSRRNKFPRNAEKANMSHLLRRKLGHSIMVHQKKMRELIRNRQRYSDVLAMARASCTYDTCLILKDPFPKDAQDDNYCQQAMCLYKTTSYFKKVLTVTDKTMKKCACHLQDDVTKSKSVGLVSMPGSGNTWVRSLLERATHICTGSLWCDPILRSNSFCGEGLRSKKTLVVKNHDSTIRWRGQTLPINSRHKAFSDYNKPLFDAVIFVHRNPFDSLVAEHNRAIANSLREKDIERNKYTTLPPNDHTSFFGEEYFSKSLCLVVW